MVATKNYVLDADLAARKLKRMALEIVEHNADAKELIIAGIREHGSVIARTLQRLIGEVSSVQTSLLDITLDKRNPGEITVEGEADFDGKVIIVVDDVSNSGKTLLYALKPFLQYRPARIQTLVLVERRHNSFPVHPDYVGLSIASTLQEHIYVEVEGDRITGAYLE